VKLPVARPAKATLPFTDPFGVAVHAANLYVADYVNNRVLKLPVQ
jgi:hypothetical protein